MAGRPRTMALRVAKLARRATSLSDDVDVIVPQQYIEKPDPDDPICEAWNAAVNKTLDASDSLEYLAILLMEKAGIASDGRGIDAICPPADEAKDQETPHRSEDECVAPGCGSA